MNIKFRSILPLLFMVLFFSCEVYEDYKQMTYPGDYFSRSISYAKCEPVGKNVFKYELAEGKVELHLNSENPYILDNRGGKSVKTPLNSLRYSERIDNSLRYLLRAGMTFEQIKLILGPHGEKWGGITGNMVVWKMADARYLAIMPSTLEMPDGMSYYHILSENQKLESAVKLIRFGQTDSLENN